MMTRTPKNMEAAKSAFNLHNVGFSTTEIVSQLEKKGYRTSGGNTYKRAFVKNAIKFHEELEGRRIDPPRVERDCFKTISDISLSNLPEVAKVAALKALLETVQ